MKPPCFSTTLRVRYIETDQMGIAHHSSVLTWMEVARIELCDALGLPYRELEKQGYHLPVVGVNIQYHKPARFDDCLTLNLAIDAKPAVKFAIHYAIMREADFVAKATTTHAFVSPEGQVLRPPALFWERLAQFIKQKT